MVKAACGRGFENSANTVEPPLVVAVAARFAGNVHQCGVERFALTEVVVEVAVVGQLCGVGLAAVGVLYDGIAWNTAFGLEDGIERGI